MIRLKKLCESDVCNIVEWNKNSSEAFLYQWAGRKAYKYPLTEKQILDRMKMEDIQIFCIEDHGEMVGSVEMSVLNATDQSIRFGRLIIGGKYRGQGYGSKAIKLVEDKAFHEHGADRLELGVFEFNRKAKQLYERLGYEVVGVIQDEADPEWTSYTMVKKRQ